LLKKVDNLNKYTKNSFQEHFSSKNQLPVGISSQNTLLNNFSAVILIFSNCIPTVSAQQVEEFGNIRNVPNSILGEQPGNFLKQP
jgi:hypothetical protein